MTLHVNMLLEYPKAQSDGGKTEDDFPPRIERIIWIDPAGEDLCLINIWDENAMWERRKCKEIEAAIDAGMIVIRSDDPYALIAPPENPSTYTPLIRANRLIIVRKVLEIGGDRLFDPDAFGSVIKQAIKELNDPVLRKEAGLVLEKRGRKDETDWRLVRYKRISAVLRLWFQRGMVPNAIDPDYRRSGAPGKPRHYVSSRRPGRKNPLTLLDGKPRGVVIDKTDRENFLRGTVIHYRTSDGRTVEETYLRIMEIYHSDGYYLKDGVLTPHLLPPHKRPTFDQYYQWFSTHRDAIAEAQAREGHHEYDLLYRPLLGGTSQAIIDADNTLEIDSTLGDIYLVADWDRKLIIGRPVIYRAKYPGSHVIAGIAVLLEGPSWMGGLLLTENVSTDKVAFCAQYGIPIREFTTGHFLAEV